MSLTQWLTRSTPIVRCTPVMNATRSLVPTPSALGDEHRVGDAGRVETEQPAERSDVREHARRERAARQRADPADDFVAGVDVDAGLLVIHLRTSESGLESSATQRSRSGAGDPSGRRPVGAADRREETLLLEVLLEHVERFAEQLDRRARRSVCALEHLQQQRRVAERDRAERERNRGALRIARRQRPARSAPPPHPRCRQSPARQARPPTREAAPGTRHSRSTNFERLSRDSPGATRS